jgi:hypothetical protein
LTARSSRARVGRTVVVVVVVALALMWIYALFVANQSATSDKLSDPAFPKAAQPVCASTVADLLRLDLVNQKASSPEERAVLVDRTSIELAVMVQRLRSLTPASGDDATAVTKWLDDWDQWLRDRATWSAKLHQNQDAPFNEKQRDTGEPNSKALNDFAKINEMPACATPAGV